MPMAASGVALERPLWLIGADSSWVRNEAVVGEANRAADLWSAPGTVKNARLSFERVQGRPELSGAVA